MPMWPVRVSGVVKLEAERALKVVAGLLVQSLHHHPVADVDNVEVWRAGPAATRRTPASSGIVCAAVHRCNCASGQMSHSSRIP
jgi:hypothetical protein